MLEKLTRIFEEIYALSLKPVLMKIKETDSMLIHISQSWNGGIFPPSGKARGGCIMHMKPIHTSDITP